MTDSRRQAPQLPKNHAEVISLWPKLADFASDLGVSYDNAKQMRRRNSIANDHWLVVIEKAAERKFKQITFELLARTAPGRRALISQEREAAQ